MKISFIAAVAENYVLGKDGHIPWHLPSDLKWFKANTLHKPCLMGRKTYESLGHPLPSRRNIVLTSQPHFECPCEVVHSIMEAMAIVDEPEMMILGGASLYRALMNVADRFYLTVVHTLADGDTRFPPIDAAQWSVSHRDFVPADERNPFAHTFFILDRLDYADVHTSPEKLPNVYRQLNST